MQASSSTHILCQFCKQFVERRISLLKHINEDLGYKPYVCNQCFGPSTVAFTAEDDFWVHSLKEHRQIHPFLYEANDLKEKLIRAIFTNCYEMDTEDAAATTQAHSETETGNGGLVGISLSAPPPTAPIDPQFTSHTPAVHSLSSTPEISNRCDSSGSNELVFPTQQNLQMANRSQCLMSSVDQHHQQLQHSMESMEQIQMESASVTTQAASNFSPSAPSAPSSNVNTSLNFDLPSGSNSEHCRSTGTLPTPVAGTPQDPEESSFCGGQQLQQNQTCSNPPVSDPSVSETPAATTRSVDHNQSRRIPSPKTPPLPTSPHRRQLLLQTAAAAAKNKRLRADAEPEIQEVQQILMQSLPASKSRRTLSTESPNKSHSQEKNASDKNDTTTTSSNPSSSFRLVTPTSTPRASPNPEQNPMQEAQEQTAIDNVTPFMSPDDFNFVADILGDLFGAGDNFDTPDPNIPTPASPNPTSTATSQENPIQTASAPNPSEMETSVSATPKVAAAVETSVTSTAPQTNVGNDSGQVNPPQPQAAAAGAIAASVFPPRAEREDGGQKTGAEKSPTSSHQVQGIASSRVKNEERMETSTKQQRHQVARRSRPFTSNRPSVQTIGKSSSHRGMGTHSYRLRQHCRRDSSSLSPIPKRRRTHSTRKKGSKRPTYKEISSSDDESDSPPAPIEVITLSSTEEFDDDDDSSYSNGSTNNESREEESNEESDDDDNKKKRWW